MFQICRGWTSAKMERTHTDTVTTNYVCYVISMYIVYVCVVHVSLYACLPVCVCVCVCVCIYVSAMVCMRVYVYVTLPRNRDTVCVNQVS
jgi:hypothetical protein